MMNSRRVFLWVAGVVLAGRGAHAEDAVRISLRVAGGKLVEGAKVIRLRKNAAVILAVVRDTADEFQVHGCNLFLKLASNQLPTLRFATKHTGLFTFELHKSDKQLDAYGI